jgi:Mn2+/Fe2+ NRAMP family transporter
VALTVLLIGVVFAVLATRPVALILLAQATNALLLPLVAVLLLVVVNLRRLLGDQRNRWQRNVLTGAVVVGVVALAAHRLLAVLP